MKKLYPISYILLLCAIFFAACTKTEYEHLKRPYNDIKLFTLIGSNGTPVKALIKDDTISVSWDSFVDLPSVITPEIVISEHATISPASGETVQVTDATSYIVTAEDGTTKTYILKIKKAVPIPVLLPHTSAISWLASSEIALRGEYFLANTDTTAISAYLQRKSDGLEIPLMLRRNLMTNFNIRAMLPTFSAEQDTGIHRLYLKVGDRASKSIDLWFTLPAVSNVDYTTDLVSPVTQISTGDSLTVSLAVTDKKYDGKVAGYYSVNNVKEILLYTEGYDIIKVNKSDLRKSNNTIQFKVPDLSDHIGKKIFQYRFVYHSVPEASEQSSTYTTRALLTTSLTILK